MSRPPEFLPLSDEAARAVAGPGSRHAALIEDAFHVLLETPGGGVSVAGDSRARAGAKRAVQMLADRADSGLEVEEADVRVAIGQASTGGAATATASRGRSLVSPKTPGQARRADARGPRRQGP